MERERNNGAKNQIMAIVLVLLLIPVLTPVRCAVLTGRIDTKIIRDLFFHKYRKYVKARGGIKVWVFGNRWSGNSAHAIVFTYLGRGPISHGVGTIDWRRRRITFKNEHYLESAYNG